MHSAQRLNIPNACPKLNVSHYPPALRTRLIRALYTVKQGYSIPVQLELLATGALGTSHKYTAKMNMQNFLTFDNLPKWAFWPECGPSDQKSEQFCEYKKDSFFLTKKWPARSVVWSDHTSLQWRAVVQNDENREVWSDPTTSGGRRICTLKVEKIKK